MRIFLKFIIILDKIKETWDIFINFQIYLWERKDFGLTLRKELEFREKIYKKLNKFLKVNEKFWKFLRKFWKFEKILIKFRRDDSAVWDVAVSSPL